METNNSNVQTLAARFATFNQQLIDFVEQCGDDDWHKVTKAEGWTVGVTAHHVGATHYPLIGWVQLMVEGQALPPVTMAMVDEMNRQHAEAYTNCTPAEVLEILHRDGDQALAYLQTINDVDLERQGYFPVFGVDLSAGQLFTAVFIDYAHQHLTSMKVTVKA